MKLNEIENITKPKIKCIVFQYIEDQKDIYSKLPQYFLKLVGYYLNNISLKAKPSILIN